MTSTRPFSIITRLFAAMTILALVAGQNSFARASELFTGFSDTSSLTLNGNASVVNTADGKVLRLAPSSPWQAGSAFFTKPVPVSQYTSVFSFRMSQPQGGGADGIVFAFQGLGPSALGEAGGGIGYAGMGLGVGIGFDSWFNSENADPNDNYVGIYLDGNVVHSTSNGPTANVLSSLFDAGGRWWSWVVRDPTSLNVYLSQDESTTEPLRPSHPILSVPPEIVDRYNAFPEAFVGFTSATGYAQGSHDLLYWRYSVPEPSSFVLLAIGGIGALATLRRRRNAVRRAPRT